MLRRPLSATLTVTLFPYSTLFRSANRHRFVIGEQRSVWPEQQPNVVGVAKAGVEIGIIAYLRRQVESAVRRLVKGWPDRILLRGICQQGEQSAAQRAAGARDRKSTL